ncbi:MAG: hypothetical protein IIC51_12160, partial [Planctomycetes bacterium]|nr:hypothetical protein [Planctomycetota bacterium]
MKNERMNRHDNSRRVLTYFGSLCLGLAVFAGTASLGAKEESSSIASAGDSTGVLSARGISSTNSSSTDSSLAAAGGDTAAGTDDDQGRQRKAAPTPGQQDQGDTDPSAAERADQDSVMHVGRVIGSIPVVSKSGQPAISRAAGGLGLGDPCSCDQDCAAVGDQCNLVQCIVRSICSGNP